MRVSALGRGISSRGWLLGGLLAVLLISCQGKKTPTPMETATLTPVPAQPSATSPLEITETPLFPAHTPTPKPSPTSGAVDVLPGTEIEYTIVAGDTLRTIADTFNSTVIDILERNPEIEDRDDIHPGQVIKIRVNIATPVPTATPGLQLPTAPVQPSATVTATNTSVP